MFFLRQNKFVLFCFFKYKIASLKYKKKKKTVADILL